MQQVFDFSMESIGFYFYHAIVIFFFIEGFFTLQHEFSTNIRYHAPHPNVSLNYSYINLKYLKGYKLDVTPLASYTVNNKSLCAKECLKTKGACKSINLRQMDVGFECEILGEDIYTSDYQLTNDSTTTHSIISVSLLTLEEFSVYTYSLCNSKSQRE